MEAEGQTSLGYKRLVATEMKKSDIWIMFQR